MKLCQKISIAAIACFLSVSFLNAAIPTGYSGVPFCCDTLQRHYQQIPGKVVCVFFDSGGQGVGYHVYYGPQAFYGSCGDAGTTMRLNAAKQPIAADVPMCMQQFGGNDHTFGSKTNPGQLEPGYWHLAWINPACSVDSGEWLKYSVHVNTAGMYYVSFHEATAYLPNLQLLTYYDGPKVRTDSVANMPVDTPLPIGCPEVWHCWSVTPNVDSVMLDTGLQVIQLTFKVGSWNMEWMQYDLHYPSWVDQTSLVHVRESDAIKVRPMENLLNVSFNLEQAGRASFSVVDCRGKLVGNRVTKFLMSGRQSQSLSLGKLSPGIYFMQMEHSGIMSESRFLIAR
jgi:hypothetical protein